MNRKKIIIITTLSILALVVLVSLYPRKDTLDEKRPSVISLDLAKTPDNFLEPRKNSESRSEIESEILNLNFTGEKSSWGGGRLFDLGESGEWTLTYLFLQGEGIDEIVKDLNDDGYDDFVTELMPEDREKQNQDQRVFGIFLGSELGYIYEGMFQVLARNTLRDVHYEGEEVVIDQVSTDLDNHYGVVQRNRFHALSNDSESKKTEYFYAKFAQNEGDYRRRTSEIVSSESFKEKLKTLLEGGNTVSVTQDFSTEDVVHYVVHNEKVIYFTSQLVFLYENDEVKILTDLLTDGYRVFDFEREPGIIAYQNIVEKGGAYPINTLIDLRENSVQYFVYFNTSSFIDLSQEYLSIKANQYEEIVIQTQNDLYFFTYACNQITESYSATAKELGNSQITLSQEGLVTDRLDLGQTYVQAVCDPKKLNKEYSYVEIDHNYHVSYLWGEIDIDNKVASAEIILRKMDDTDQEDITKYQLKIDLENSSFIK